MQEDFLFKYVLRPFSFWLIYSATALAANNSARDISFGRVEIGESRIDLQANDFQIQFDLKKEFQKKLKIQVRLINKSFQWIRTEEVLLTPRARVEVIIEGDAQNYHLSYEQQSLIMQQSQKGAHTEFYVSLFNHSPIQVYHQGQYVGDISFIAKNKNTYKGSKDANRNNHLIDYSCSRKNIQIKGLDGELLSLGCRTHRIGKFGSERPMMEILWSSANYRLLDGSRPPYIAVFLDNYPIRLKVQNRKGEVKEIEISARLPKRLHRLNTAYGFGPYAFHTSFTENPENEDDKLEYKEDIAPALMLYFNFKLSAMNSIRGFDAAVWKRSTFNNAGVYFASDVASILDGKLTITTLLGMQHLYFQFDKEYETISEPIFPQGIEFLYKHAFGIENYIVSGGAFISPSETIDYQNIWIRWGKNYFWELNYIYWGKDQFDAGMYGLSIGLPFKGFF